MEQNEILLLITVILMALVTFVPRVLPLQLNADNWPQWLKSIAEYLPVAVVGAITIPVLIVKNGEIIDRFAAEQLAAIAVITVAYFSRNLIVSIIIGLVVFIVSDTYLF